MRILPRNNDGVNEEWLADRSRFIWDGLRRQRLDRPFVREGGRLRPATWGEAFEAVAAAVKGKKVAGLVGDLVSTEAAFALKGLVEGLGGTVECRTDGAALPAGNRSGYVGTARIADIDAARRILLVGTNPRLEAPVLNARIRKAWLHGATIARIGEAADLSYPVIEFGAGREKLAELNRETVSEEERAIPSLVIVGAGALAGDGAGGAGAGDGALRADGVAASGAAHGGEPGGGDGPRLRDRGRRRRGAEGGRDPEPRGRRGGDPGGAVRGLSGEPRRPRARTGRT